MKKLAVFPSDDVEEYFKKGEVRKNYYNPNNMFSEIFIFNMSEEKDLNKKLLQFMCGKAKFKVIFLGADNYLKKILKLNAHAKDALSELKKIKPDIIRSYGMLFNSYIAAYCSRKTKIPLIISLHDNYNGTREIALKTKEYKNYLFYVYWKKRHEKWILNSADKIIAMYNYAKLYALDMGIQNNNVSVIYNKVDNSFRPKNIKKYRTFTVINIMRQNWMKNQQVLIRAIAEIKNIRLILIGNGPDHEMLKKLAKDLDCEKRVIFIKSVMNKKLPEYYQKSHIFATSVIQRGVGIPVLESLSSGTPVIHAKYPEEKNSDIISEYTYMVNNNPESFRNAILQLKNNHKIYKEYSNKGLKFAKKINYKSMSKKEERIYIQVLKDKRKQK